jgi:hypothetical protein
VLNVKLPLALTDRLLPPLSCKTSPVPVSPETVPPMVYVVGGGGVVPPPVLLPPQPTTMDNGMANITKTHNLPQILIFQVLLSK